MHILYLQGRSTNHWQHIGRCIRQSKEEKGACLSQEHRVAVLSLGFNMLQLCEPEGQKTRTRSLTPTN